MNEPYFEIAWDPAKAQRNLAKHGVAFDALDRLVNDLLALDIESLDAGR